MDKTILQKEWKKTDSVWPWSNRPERERQWYKRTVDSVAMGAGGVKVRVSLMSRY